MTGMEGSVMASLSTLSEEELSSALAQLPDWKCDDKWLVRRFRFADYLTGVAFVTRVAEFAESRNHHPLIAIDYKNVTVKWTSWHAGGLTVEDLESARRTDEAFAGMTSH